MTKKLKLSQGYYSLVDDEDYDFLNQWKWSYRKGYATRADYTDKKNIKWNVSISRVLMNPPKGMLVDHINGNTLDNRKSNLRIATCSQNQHNSCVKIGKFKGVSFDKTKNKWVARISLNKTVYRLGLFSKKEDAAKAYNDKAIILHGEFARLNNV